MPSMRVRYTTPTGETKSIDCDYLEEGEKGVKLYDEDGNLIGYIIYNDLFEAVPDDHQE